MSPSVIPATSGQSPPTTEPDNKQKRHYLGLGEWLRVDARSADAFADDKLYSEPHLFRRRAILKAYPQVTKLNGTAMETFYVAVLQAGCQVILAYMFGRRWLHLSPLTYWTMFTVAVMTIGGTLTALVGVIEHEACHNLVHRHTLVNRACSFIANIPMIVPVAASFKRYHLEHHTWQGVQNRDPDLPMAWEVRLIRGNAVLKLLWLCIYPAMYGIRGFAMGKSVSEWEVYNAVFMVVVDVLLWGVVGPWGLAYLAASVWFGYSLHPAAAHFIQEHYTFHDKQETYSYYGPLNWITMNIGLHNEHHDFVQVPWTRIWALWYVAREYYEPLEQFDSWTGVHWRFLTDDTMGPVSRLSRSLEVHRADRKQQ